MRLLWLIDSLAVGGAERLVAIFARQAAARGIDLRVVCMGVIDGNPLARELEAVGVPVTVLGARNLRDIRAFRHLLRLIRHNKIDLIHAHLTYSEIWARLAGWFTATPVVSTAHVRQYTNPHNSSPRDRKIERLVGFVRKHFGGPVIAVSDALRDRLLARGLPPQRAVTVHNGIETEHFELRSGIDRTALRAEFDMPAAAPVVLTVGVIRAGKGHDVLIAAARAVLATVPDAHFLIAGGGPLEGGLRGQVAELGLEKRIHFAGMRGDVPNLMAIADLFVLPSSQFDALPTVTMEAMAAGLPVIAFASGGVAEIVVEGQTGRILPRVDAGDLAEAITNLLSEPNRVLAMGRAGLERVKAEFSAGVWSDRLIDFYRQRVEPQTGPATVLGKPPPRILVVEFFGRGGLVHYAYQMCQALAEQNADVELVTDRDYELAAMPHAFPVRRIFRLWDPRPQGEVQLPTSLGARLRRLTRRIGRGAVHYREWFRLIRLVRRERPDVVQFGEIRFATDLLPLFALRLMGIRLADVCHNVAPFDVSSGSARLTRESRWNRAVFRRIYACFETIFVHSDVNRQEFVRLYGGDPARICVIPHGNEDMFRLAAAPAGGKGLAGQLAMKAGSPTVLFFGTLTKYKGLDHLLEAFSMVRRTIPDARLVVAGFPNPDVDVTALQERAGQPDLSGAVRFHLEYVEMEDVSGLFENSALAVFPYLMIYQSGALQIAYSFAKPVVATRVGGLAEAVIDQETGLLVPPRDKAALAGAITALLGDPDRARAMGERGRQLSEGAFSWRSIAGQVRQAHAAPFVGAARPGASPPAGALQ
ncbi:MAG: glycosyltransferase [Novosphingobium sp.]